MTRQELAQQIATASLLHGHFVLRSGRTSTYYLDKYLFSTQPQILARLGHEFAARIPPEMKLFAPDGSTSQKYLLKKYVNQLLPGDAFTRKKQGFGVPIDSWFRDDLYNDVRTRLLDEAGILEQLFDRGAREELVASPSAAYANAPRVWSLLFLRAWADRAGVTL